MTEKRFTIHGDVVSDTDMKIPITLWSDKKQQKKFCDELNALHEENEQLKTFLEALREELSLADRDNTALEKENEELKKENKELEAFRYAVFKNIEEHRE